MLRSYPSHGVFEVYEDAAQAYDLSVRMVGFSDFEDDRYLRVPIGLRNLLNPWVVSARIARLAREGNVVILREFLTLPLFLAAPALLRSRDRLLLLCVHNVQRAHQRPRDRMALRALARWGFRFLLPESWAGSEILGTGGWRSRSLMLPLGATSEHLASPTGPKAGQWVGSIGASRREKRGRDAVERLRDALDGAGLDAGILVGRPGERDRVTEDGRVRYTDTTTTEAYRRALAACSAVFLDYSEADYRYRTSGTILDAAAARTAVVCPDFPVFRTQIEEPVAIGATFRGEEDLGGALGRALEISRDRPEAFDAYLGHRGREAIAGRLKAFLAETSPTRGAGAP